MKGYFTERMIWRAPQWKLSVTFSLIIHILLGMLIFLIPVKEKERITPFFANIITPDELKQEFPAGSSIGLPSKTVAVPQRQQEKVKPQPDPLHESAVPRKETPVIQPPPDPSAGNMNEKAGDMDIAEKDKPASQSGRESTPSGHPQAFRGKTIPSLPLREKLFDREIVERLAKKEEIKKDAGITFDSEEFKHHDYMRRLKERIEGAWEYPPDAAMRGLYGDLYIKFTIKKDGLLGNMELMRTSGHRSLDEAAMKALKNAEPFWPLPEEWGKETLTIDGHFVYSIYGTYIR